MNVNVILMITKKNEFASVLGFVNTAEAICCFGSKNFNHEFKKYFEYVQQHTV